MICINRLRARIRRNRDDDGFTLVELLVAASLAIILGGLVLSTILTASASVSTTQTVSDLNGEATQLLNRLAGDLRQAMPVWNSGTEVPAIVAVQNPFPGGSASGVTSITFEADFDGDGCIAGVVSDGCNPAKTVDPSDPETESFCWNPSSQLVYLIGGGVSANSCTPSNGSTQPPPLLSGKVSSLKITYDSSSYLYDADHNGITTWQELDAAAPPIGNGNNKLDVELPRIDSVQIDITVTEGGHTESFETLVTLRNVS